MLRFGASPARRRPSLTPMIDVVFLLVVFFMLASQFGREGAIGLAAGGGGAEASGPPRLVGVAAEGVTLNGRPVSEAELVAGLQRLTASPADLIALRAAEDVALQRLLDVAEALRAAGFAGLVLVE